MKRNYNLITQAKPGVPIVRHKVERPDGIIQFSIETPLGVLSFCQHPDDDHPTQPGAITVSHYDAERDEHGPTYQLGWWQGKHFVTDGLKALRYDKIQDGDDNVIPFPSGRGPGR